MEIQRYRRMWKTILSTNFSNSLIFLAIYRLLQSIMYDYIFVLNTLCNPEIVPHLMSNWFSSKVKGDLKSLIDGHGNGEHSVRGAVSINVTVVCGHRGKTE